MNATEKTIAIRALEAFRNATGLDARYQPDAIVGQRQADGIVRIENGDQNLELATEIKRGVNRATVGLVRRQMHEVGRILLLTDYVNPELADTLKDHGIGFIDTVGNAFINEPPLYVYIKGNKPKNDLKKDRVARLFKPGGLRVLFALLNQPGAEDKPYRDIAADAGVALGTVNWVVYDLKDAGFLVTLGRKGRRLINRADLLRRWVEAYPEQLRPKLVQARFRTEEPNWWKDVKPAEYGALWGGEIAAAEMTGHLKPERFVIYTDQPPGELVFRYRLKKDVRGNVEILKPFWKFDWQTAERGLVPTLLVYADLMATADPRNVEAAEMIYDEHLAGLVRED